MNGNKELLILDDKAHSYARIYSSLIKEQYQRKRANAAIMSLFALASFLKKFADVKVQNSMTMYRTPFLCEQFEIADFYVNNYHIDVRITNDDNFVLIPSVHYENSIVPDFYAVISVDILLKKAELTGFINTSQINPEPLDSRYYKVNTQNLTSLNEFLEFVKEPKEQIFDEKAHDIFHEKYLSLIDNEIGSQGKIELLKHMFSCPDCRTEFCCFTGFEMVSCHAADYPEIFNDQTLYIIGADAAENENYKGKEETIYFDDDNNTQDNFTDSNTDEISKNYVSKPLDAKTSSILDTDNFIQDETKMDFVPDIPNSEQKNNTENIEKNPREDDLLDELFSDNKSGNIELIHDDYIKEDTEIIEEGSEKNSEHQNKTEATEENVQKIITDYDEHGNPIYSYITGTDGTGNINKKENDLNEKEQKLTENNSVQNNEELYEETLKEETSSQTDSLDELDILDQMFIDGALERETREQEEISYSTMPVNNNTNAQEQEKSPEPNQENTLTQKIKNEDITSEIDTTDELKPITEENTNDNSILASIEADSDNIKESEYKTEQNNKYDEYTDSSESTANNELSENYPEIEKSPDAINENLNDFEGNKIEEECPSKFCDKECERNLEAVTLKDEQPYGSVDATKGCDTELDENKDLTSSENDFEEHKITDIENDNTNNDNNENNSINNYEEDNEYNEEEDEDDEEDDDDEDDEEDDDDEDEEDDDDEEGDDEMNDENSKKSSFKNILIIIGIIAALLIISGISAFFFIKNKDTFNIGTFNADKEIEQDEIISTQENDLFDTQKNENDIIIPQDDTEINDDIEIGTVPIKTIPLKSYNTETDKNSSGKASDTNIEIPFDTQESVNKYKSPQNNSDINKAITKALSSGRNLITLRGVNWKCEAELFSDRAFKKYLQNVDNKLKQNLKNNIMAVTEIPPKNQVTAKFAIDNNRNLRKVIITQSSGSEEVDEIVLQSINETFEGEKSPILTDSPLKAAMYFFAVVINL